jgi:hypothetical protein
MATTATRGLTASQPHHKGDRTMRYTICSTGCLTVTKKSYKAALKAGYAIARAAFSGGVTTVYAEPGDDDDIDIATPIARWHRHPGRARPMRIEAF